MPPGEVAQLEDGEVVAQRVVAVVVAERTFGTADSRRNVAHQSDLAAGDERVGTRAADDVELLSGDETGEQKLGNVLRQRRHRGQRERGRATEERGDGEALPARLGHRVV